MASQPYTPTEHWYRPGSDRSSIGQKKIEELQRQLASMQRDVNDRNVLDQKLRRIQEIEQEKRNTEDKVLERNSRGSTPRLLKSEMERLYGRDTPRDADIASPVDRTVVENMIKHRTKEFSAKQQEANLKAKYLDKERKRLQEARRRIEEQRQALLHAQSPTGKTPIPLERDMYYVNDQPYHWFTRRLTQYRDSVTLPLISAELTLCNICKCPTPIEYAKCFKCDKNVYITDKLPRCNYCKYMIPDDRKVFNNTTVTDACCRSVRSPVSDRGSILEEVEREGEVRLCDSCVPSKTFEIPNNEKWKFKVKFVPVPYEEQPVWLKYQDQVTSEKGEEVDEAVRAFQSFTEKKNTQAEDSERKSKKPSVRYVDLPLYRNEPVKPHQQPQKRQKRVHYSDMFGLNNTFPRSNHTFLKADPMPSAESIPGHFREDMKFTVMHDQYRQPEFRHVLNYKDAVKGAKGVDTTKGTQPSSTWVTTVGEDKVKMYQEIEKAQVKRLRLKVKYRAMPLPETNTHK